MIGRILRGEQDGVNFVTPEDSVLFRIFAYKHYGIHIDPPSKQSHPLMNILIIQRDTSIVRSRLIRNMDAIVTAIRTIRVYQKIWDKDH